MTYGRPGPHAPGPYLKCTLPQEQVFYAPGAMYFSNMVLEHIFNLKYSSTLSMVQGHYGPGAYDRYSWTMSQGQNLKKKKKKKKQYDLILQQIGILHLCGAIKLPILD